MAEKRRVGQLWQREEVPSWDVNNISPVINHVSTNSKFDKMGSVYIFCHIKVNLSCGMRVTTKIFFCHHKSYLQMIYRKSDLAALFKTIFIPSWMKGEPCFVLVMTSQRCSEGLWIFDLLFWMRSVLALESNVHISNTQRITDLVLK